MLRLLKFVLFLVIFGGAFGAAYLGLESYMKGHKDGGLFSGMMGLLGRSAPADAVASKPPPNQFSSIVDAYRKPAELTKASGADIGTSGTATGLAKPARTPDPSMKVIREFRTGHNRVALTFDDGPHPAYTPRFIELLKSKNAKATFFLIGDNVKKNPEIAKSLVDNGFEVGNHSWTHPILSKLTPAKAQDELSRTSDAIKEATGVLPTLMRPPYGSANKMVQDLCDSMKMKIICWNIDTNDWKKGSVAEAMTKLIMKNTHDGTIILMHDRQESTYKTTEAVIDQLRAAGFEFVTVSELLGYEPVKPLSELAASMATGTSATVAAVVVPAASPDADVAPLPAP
ncbi:MAG: polysaccharide deacetylase family protein, partial [Candidatus Sumerlaeaceae bacterium]|nr:polysaccharide deacetylase family protein [Candidatus Sumerlaeaceae bacterium]